MRRLLLPKLLLLLRRLLVDEASPGLGSLDLHSLVKAICCSGVEDSAISIWGVSTNSSSALVSLAAVIGARLGARLGVEESS